jgi:hypothetical protein
MHILGVLLNTCGLTLCCDIQGEQHIKIRFSAYMIVVTSYIFLLPPFILGVSVSDWDNQKIKIAFIHRE